MSRRMSCSLTVDAVSRTDRDVVTMAQLRRLIVETSKFIDSTYPAELCREAVDRRRVDKLAEELGEVVEAFGGWVGENPRKGVTHRIEDVLGELLDVAACALGAFEHLDRHRGHALQRLAVHVKAKRDRLFDSVRSADLRPGDVIEFTGPAHCSPATAVIKCRKIMSDDGWWLEDGGGIADTVFDGPHWRLRSRP